MAEQALRAMVAIVAKHERQGWICVLLQLRLANWTM